MLQEVRSLRQLRQHCLPVGVVDAVHRAHELRVGLQLGWRVLQAAGIQRHHLQPELPVFQQFRRHLAEDEGSMLGARSLERCQQDLLLVLELRWHFAVDVIHLEVVRPRDHRKQPRLHKLRIRPQLVRRVLQEVGILRRRLQPELLIGQQLGRHLAHEEVCIMTFGRGLERRQQDILLGLELRRRVAVDGGCLIARRPREPREQLRLCHELRIRPQLVRHVLQAEAAIDIALAAEAAASWSFARPWPLRQLRQHCLPAGIVTPEHHAHDVRVCLQLRRRVVEDVGSHLILCVRGLECRQQDLLLGL